MKRIILPAAIFSLIFVGCTTTGIGYGGSGYGYSNTHDSRSYHGRTSDGGSYSIHRSQSTYGRGSLGTSLEQAGQRLGENYGLSKGRNPVKYGARGAMYGQLVDMVIPVVMEMTQPSVPAGGFHTGNPGVEAAYNRGVAERPRQIQRELEQDAYHAGRGW